MIVYYQAQNSGWTFGLSWFNYGKRCKTFDECKIVFDAMKEYLGRDKEMQFRIIKVEHSEDVVYMDDNKS